MLSVRAMFNLTRRWKEVSTKSGVLVFWERGFSCRLVCQHAVQLEILQPDSIATRGENCDRGFFDVLAVRWKHNGNTSIIFAKVLSRLDPQDDTLR
jgi:hypothetical protein